MVGSKQPWGDMHHRSSFLLELEKMEDGPSTSGSLGYYDG